MTELNVQARQDLLPQLLGRIKLSNFLALSEQEFAKFVKKVEDSELFKKFAYPDKQNMKIISFKRYPYTLHNKRLLEFKDEIHAAPGDGADIYNLVKENRKIVEKIKSIGLKNFNKFFLYSETDLGLDEIAALCKISLVEAKMIINFVNSSLIHDNRPMPGRKGIPDEFLYRKIAKISTQPKGRQPLIEFFSLNYSRGRYIIDYRKLSEIKSKNLLPKHDLTKLDNLLRKLELINTRKTILYQALIKIINKQSVYLNTGKLKDLRPYTQSMLAAELGVNKGTISRAINYKTVETPWGEEKEIRFFLINGKQTRKYLLRDIIMANESLPDHVLRDKVKQKMGILLARRTICQYRNELQKTRYATSV